MDLYIFRPNGIFHCSLRSILLNYPDIPFFYKWLNAVDKIIEWENDEKNLEKFERYLMFKVKINHDPNQDIQLKTEEDKEFVYRLIRDFLVELNEPFITKTTTNAMREYCKQIELFEKKTTVFRIISRLYNSIVDYSGKPFHRTLTDKHLFLCQTVQTLYMQSETHDAYKIFKALIELAVKLGGSNHVIATVVDLMQIPEDDKIEKVAFAYFLMHRKMLFFDAKLWAEIEECHYNNYSMLVSFKMYLSRSFILGSNLIFALDFVRYLK